MKMAGSVLLCSYFGFVSIFFTVFCQSNNETVHEDPVVNSTSFSNETVAVNSTYDVSPLSANVSSTTVVPVSDAGRNLTIFGAKISNDNILGCIWPDDVLTRYHFCMQRANLSSNYSDDEGLFYGLLHRQTMKHLVETCKKGSCDTPMKEVDIQASINWWKENQKNIDYFRDCLQQNTEGMVRLCGIGTTLGSVISGIVGLHINTIDALLPIIRSEKSTDSACLRHLSEAVHITMAIYLSTEFYRENAVFCWDVTRGKCDSICQQIAKIVNCMHRDCAKRKTDVERIGIWQWYFMDQTKALKTCNVTNDADCSSMEVKPPGTDFIKSAKNFKELFTNLGERFHEFKQEVESQLNMPFYLIATFALFALGIIILATIVICMWQQRLIWRKPKRDLRYSKIIPTGILRSREETQALTVEEDDL